MVTVVDKIVISFVSGIENVVRFFSSLLPSKEEAETKSEIKEESVKLPISEEVEVQDNLTEKSEEVPLNVAEVFSDSVDNSLASPSVIPSEISATLLPSAQLPEIQVASEF